MTAKVWFVLDEAVSLHSMDALSDMMQIGRGYGLRSIFAYQSMGQLQECWPEGKAQVFLSNTTQIFFGVNDPTTADYVSNRLGDATILTEGGGSNTGWGRSHGETYGCHPSSNAGWNTSGGNSSNWSMMARRLLKPDEVMALHPLTVITFPAPGCGAPPRPIKTLLVRYFEEPGLFRMSFFGGFGSSLKELGKAFLFMLAGLGLAYALSVWALAREQQPVSQPFPEWRTP
jgi:type IV secretion system protein VirD4